MCVHFMANDPLPSGILACDAMASGEVAKCTQLARSPKLEAILILPTPTPASLRRAESNDVLCTNHATPGLHRTSACQ